jgi:uncharacterized protein (TIGR04255 family)
MSAASGAIHSFKTPPVTEVVLGVSFRAIAGLSVPYLGQLWRENFAEHFPSIEEQPPYVPPVERFDPGGMMPNISLEFQAVTIPRLWFLTRDGDELLQVQRNWFACNWRKVTPGAAYDRYPPRRAAFEKWFTTLSDFVRHNDLGEIAPVQCEVTYVNHILSNSAWQNLGQLDRVVKFVNRVKGDFLREPDQVRVNAQYIISNASDEPIGRLHLDAQPAFRTEDRKPMFVLNLTARGKPEGDDLNGILAFLDRGRQWIVEAFVDMTTEEMQKEWGRYA